MVTANVVPSSLILVTLLVESVLSSETLFLQEPHGVTSQKTEFFIVTALKPSKFLQFVFRVINYIFENEFA
jgi:hypothetical protein